MIQHAKITVYLSDKSIVQFKNSTLLNVVKQCLGYPLAKSNPKMLQIDTLTKLYFNTTLFIAWIKKEIDAKQLFKYTKVDELVKNTQPISLNDIIVKPNSLWLKKRKFCFLEHSDDEEYALIRFDDRFTNYFN